MSKSYNRIVCGLAALLMFGGLWLGNSALQAATPPIEAAVTVVDSSEAEEVTGGFCWYYTPVDILIYVNLYGCGTAAKTYPTTTACIKLPNYAAVVWPLGDWGTIGSGDCYECGMGCGTYQAFSGCSY